MLVAEQVELPRPAPRADARRRRPSRRWSGSERLGSPSVPETRSRACRTATSSACSSPPPSCTARAPRARRAAARASTRPGIDAHRRTCSSSRPAPGACVLFSSHQLDLVEDLCQSVTIIDHGRLVVSATSTSSPPSGRPPPRGPRRGRPRRRRGRGDLPGRPASRRSTAARSASCSTTASTATSSCAPPWRAGPVTAFGFERRRLSEVFREALAMIAAIVVARRVCSSSSASASPVGAVDERRGHRMRRRRASRLDLRGDVAWSPPARSESACGDGRSASAPAFILARRGGRDRDPRPAQELVDARAGAAGRRGDAARLVPPSSRHGQAAGHRASRRHRVEPSASAARRGLSDRPTSTSCCSADRARRRAQRSIRRPTPRRSPSSPQALAEVLGVPGRLPGRGPLARSQIAPASTRAAPVPSPDASCPATKNPNAAAPR